MAANPSDRFASAGAFQKARNRYLAWPKVRAVAAGVAAVVLLGGWGYAMIAAGWRASQPPKPNPPIPQPTPPAIALAGDLTVRVWSMDDGGKHGLKIDEPARYRSFPAIKCVWKPGSTSRPMRTCSGSTARARSLCSTHATTASTAAGRRGVRREPWCAEHPSAEDEGHPMSGPGGLETVLLLAARTPLPAGIDLAGLIGKLPPSPLGNPLEFRLWLALTNGSRMRPSRSTRIAGSVMSR